jgi:probable rRNA maturation factor
MVMEIAVKNCQRSIKVKPDSVESVVRSALNNLSAGRRIEGHNLASGLSFDPSQAVVSILFVGDKKMRELNRTYRGIDRTTDVLSFSQLEGPSFVSGTVDLGDIVISPAQAKRQAADRAGTLDQEISLLLIHGLLHLIGYDHEKNRYQAEKMRRKEKELLSAVKKVGR